MIQATTSHDRLLLAGVQSFTDTLQRLQADIGPGAVPQPDAALHELSQAIRTMSRKCRLRQLSCDEPEQLQSDRRRFQERIAPWFNTSWFMHRAKQKPRGYPGDYSLLSAIYAGQPRSLGLGGYLDLYFLQSDLGRAVVARMHATREFLSQQIRDRAGDLTIVNVACGPCREFFSGWSVPLEQRTVTVYCIDADEEALDFVRQQLVTYRGPALPQFQLVSYNALRMRAAKHNIARFGMADIIYSIGLLDYLPDKHLVATLRGLRESLKPGGVAFLAFKDMHGYDCCEYQWFVDWFFYQRDERQCRALLIEAGFAPEDVLVQRDETGIIMNFVATVPSRVTIRADEPNRPVRSARAAQTPLPHSNY